MAGENSFPYFNVNDVEHTPFDLGEGRIGLQAILYKSPDGKRLAGSFKETGMSEDEVLPYDIFIYVVAGTTTLRVVGEKPVVLGVGDCCYLPCGTSLTFDHSDDFQDVVMVISDDEPIVI